MARADLSYLLHWFPRVAIKPRRWKAVTDLSAFQPAGMALQSYSPGGGFGGPGVAQITRTKPQPSAHP